MKKQTDSRHLFLRRQKIMATNTLLFYTSRRGDIYYFHSILRDGFEIWFGVQGLVLIHRSPEFSRKNETPYFQNRGRDATILRCVYAKICFVEKNCFCLLFQILKSAMEDSKLLKFILTFTVSTNLTSQ